MTKRTVEIKGSELPDKLRGQFGPDQIVRVTIETIENTARQKMRAKELIGAAKRLGEAPKGDGSGVEADLRALREEWDR